MEIICIILIGILGIFYLIGVEKSFYLFQQYGINEERSLKNVIMHSACTVIVCLGSWISVKKINKLINDRDIEPPYMKYEVDQMLQEGFFSVRPKFTTLKVEIFLDQTGICKDRGYPLMLYARNGYSIKASTFIPISISEHPKILNSEMEILIMPNEVEEIKDFIRRNWFEILKFSKNEIGVNQLIHHFK